MTALRFAAGIGAGVAIAALLAGAADLVPPTAAEPDAAPPAPREQSANAAPARPAPAPKKASVERGVLARAAASRRAKPAEANPPAAGATGRAKNSKDAVIESVEVDWGAPAARP